MPRQHDPAYHMVTVVDRIGRRKQRIPLGHQPFHPTSKYDPATEDRKHAVLPASRRMQQAWKRVQGSLRAMAGIGV